MPAKQKLYILTRFIPVLLAAVLLFSFLQKPDRQKGAYTFPYAQEGLTDIQAASHLANRFTYGPTPDLISKMLDEGLENWFEKQLEGHFPDKALKERLNDYDALLMSNEQIMKAFPKPIQVARMARAENVIKDDSLQVKDPKKYKQLLSDFSKQKNFRVQAELYRQFFNAKVLRSTYSENQLHEVLTEFWFNHFNVSMTNRPCALFIPNYERDAIRPFVTGRFRDMLMATAKNPAMLIYLDNFNSSGFNDEFDEGKTMKRLSAAGERLKRGDSSAQKVITRIKQAQTNKGLNENYAREVMELHTLGVDGGYTQKDVTEAARVLTGWTIYPIGEGFGQVFQNLINKFGEENLKRRGFVHEGDFLFAISRHDNKPKTVLGKYFDGSTGYREGVDLLTMLSKHTSTAKFICKKIATRFVSDTPPASLIDQMAKTFLSTDGDIKEVLKSMVRSPEFWKKENLRSKTKSPYELVISSFRAMQVDVEHPFKVFGITERMGQKMYHYAAPTGFPDYAQYWINSGALLNRMNFGMAIAGQQIRGVSTDLLALNNNHEPEGPNDALQTYCRILLPGRDVEPTIKKLTPLLTDPTYAGRIGEAVSGNQEKRESAMKDDDDLLDLLLDDEADMREKRKSKQQGNPQGMLAQVVGIIIGSPEFQRK